MDPGTALLISGGVSALSSLFGGLTQSKAQRSANETNIQLAREQMEWNEQMWNKQNEYNTPLAQMQRLKAAGLNPALMYSQGNVGNASDVKSYNRASVNPVNPYSGVQNAASVISQSIAAKQQLDLQDAQIAQANAQTKYILAQADWYDRLSAGRLGLWNSQRNWTDTREANDAVRGMYLSPMMEQQMSFTSKKMTQMNFNMAMDQARFYLDLMKFDNQRQLTKAQIYHLYTSAANVSQRTNMLENIAPHQLAKAVADAGKALADQKIRENDLEWYIYNQLVKLAGPAASSVGSVLKLVK